MNREIKKGDIVKLLNNNRRQYAKGLIKGKKYEVSNVFNDGKTIQIRYSVYLINIFREDVELIEEETNYYVNRTRVDSKTFNKRLKWANKYNEIQELRNYYDEFFLITKDIYEDFEEDSNVNSPSHYKQGKHDAIEPEHYRKGQIDLIESWYLRYPFNEFKTGMVMYADRYFNRSKNNRVEDMEKGLYVMQRLKEYEELEKEKSNE